MVAQENHKMAEKQKKKRVEIEKTIRAKRFCMRMSHVYNPTAALTFVAVYWFMGLRNAQFCQA